MSKLSKVMGETAQLIMLALEENPKTAFSANEIAKKIGTAKGGRNLEVSHALKYLKRNKKIVQFSNGAKGPGSVYAISKDALIPKPTSVPITQNEPTPTFKEKPQPVCTIELSKATLKVLVKAVMANCQPMDGILQRAVLQCMEKLI